MRTMVAVIRSMNDVGGMESVTDKEMSCHWMKSLKCTSHQNRFNHDTKVESAATTSTTTYQSCFFTAHNLSLRADISTSASRERSTPLFPATRSTTQFSLLSSSCRVSAFHDSAVLCSSFMDGCSQASFWNSQTSAIASIQQHVIGSIFF